MPQVNRGRKSRNKGKRGEREFRDVLREHGFLKAYRGQQFCGSSESPDVVCEEMPSIHWEVKRVEKGNLYVWMRQAIEDCGDKIPAVAHRRNHDDWLVVMRADDFLKIFVASDYCVK